MSSTTGVQNLLVNTFRPVYTYDTTSTLYTVKLDLSNVNTYYGNSANVLWAQVGDSACNVYVGKEAGNDPTITIKACSNVTAIGYAAASNVSNVSNSVFAGTSAGANAQSMSNMVGVGFQAGSGTNSVRVGAGTTGVGISNTVVGSGSTTGTYSNCVLVGPGLTADQSWRFRVGTSTAPFIIGDISTGWVGINRSAPITANTKLDVGGDLYVLNNLGVNTIPGPRTFDLNGNFRARDGASNIFDVSGGNMSLQKDTDIFSVSNGLTRSTVGYASIQSNINVSDGPSATTIGTIQRGIIHISAIDQASANNRAAYIYFAWSDSNVLTLASSTSVITDISTNATDIQITHTALATTYDYSITYFPLP